MNNPRTLPFSEDLEKGLLSSIRYRPEILYELHDVLRPDMFYIPAHALILQAFATIAEQSAMASGIDFLAVKQHLKAGGKLEETGGPEFLNEIFDFVPSGEGWRFYADGVLEHYQRRVGILEFQRSIEQLYDLQSPVKETIREVIERTLAKLAIQGGQPKKTLKDLAHEFMEILEKRRLHPEATGINFGLPALDKIVIGLHGGKLCVIMADTNVGKSAFALQTIRTTSLERGFASALFSLEMSWIELLERLHMQAGVPFASLRRGTFTEAELKIVMDTTELFIGHDNIFIEDDFGENISDICSRSRALKAQHDIKLIVVDYLQLVSASVGRDGNREREVATVSRRLKALARELDLVIFSLSQVNEHGYVRESRAIGHDADVMLAIHRPETESEPYEIEVRKQRNGPTGIFIPVRFRGEEVRFVPIT